MIGYLKGKVILTTERSVILDVSGVGYEIFLPNNFLNKISKNLEYEMWTHTYVKEDILALYGFESRNDKILFTKIINISGIGPKTGLDIIGTPRETLQNAIAWNDHSLLTAIPGIGKKTAEKLLIELKSIFEKHVEPMDIKTSSGVKSLDIVGALENLGFRKENIIKVLNSMPNDINSEEEILKYALREMNKTKI